MALPGIGPGPVFAYEWLVASRRWQMFALRAALVALLLMAFSLAWLTTITNNTNEQQVQSQQRHILANIGENSFYAIIGTLLGIVLLAAPAATAGSICRDKVSGALLQLMTTDLRDREIVLGKYLGRLIPVLGLVLASAPVLFLASLLGGIDLNALFAAFLVILGCALVGCSLAMVLSVYGTKTHEVLLVTYVIWVTCLLASPIYASLIDYLSLPAVPEWLAYLNPFWIAFAPYWSPGATDIGHNVRFLVGSVVVSLIFLGLTWLRMRQKVLAQAARVSKARSRWSFWRELTSWSKPSLDRRPLLWWEWHRRRPSLWVRLVWCFYGFMTLLFTLLSIVHALMDNGRGEFPLVVNATQVTVGLLLLSVSSVTGLAEERGRGSLEVLFTTPLSTPRILLAKWASSFHLVILLAVPPTLVGVAEVVAHGFRAEILLIPAMLLAYGMFITGVGLAIATWVQRFARAVSLAVGVYVALLFSPFVAIFVLRQQNNQQSVWMVLGCPFYGIGFLTAALEDHDFNEVDLLVWCPLWILFFGLSALVLYALTLATFNRCLGRLPERLRQRPTPDREDDRIPDVAMEFARS